jgi:hypothetical protein
MVIGDLVGGRLGWLEWKLGAVRACWVRVTGSLSLVKWGRERNKAKELQKLSFFLFLPSLHMGCCVYSLRRMTPALGLRNRSRAAPSCFRKAIMAGRRGREHLVAFDAEPSGRWRWRCGAVVLWPRVRWAHGQGCGAVVARFL